MSSALSSELAQKTCVPCEGGVPPVPRDAAVRHLESLPGWKLVESGKEIEKKWTVKNFVAALEFANRIGEMAEAEQHHPDLHLTGYRHLRVVLSTHAIGGLSMNDFIMAAKIEQIPVSEKK